MLIGRTYLRKGEINMPQYDIYVFCNECSNVHPMRIRIARDDGPVEKTSIGDLFKGKELPQDIVNMKNNMTICPNTGNAFIQEDNDQVFLVPVQE